MISRTWTTILAAAVLALPAAARAQTQIDTAVDKSAWVEDAWDSRMFYTASGRSLRAGHGYAGAVGLGIIPFTQFGLTDRLSIGVAAPLFVTVAPSVKFQVVRSHLVNASVGTITAFLWEGARVGAAYANVTIGTRDTAVTGGVARVYAREARGRYERTADSDSAVIVTVAAEHRFHPRLKFITENFISKDFTLLSAGLRYIGDRWSMDFGVHRPVTSEFIIFPLLNVVWKFAR